MGEIYELASTVFVYLGEEADNSTEAMKYLDSINSTTWDAPMADVVKQAIIDLLQRPWFSRVWVLQEVFNARSVQIICGQNQANWTSLQTFRWWHRLGRQDIYIWPLVTTIKDRSNYFTYNLLGLLTSARKCGATDQRDRLYALLPMLRDAKEEGLIPNYTISREQVYLEFATYMSRRGIEFLCAVSHPLDSLYKSGLPTWVPQWDTDNGCIPLWPDTGQGLVETPTMDHNGRTMYEEGKTNELQVYESGGPRRYSKTENVQYSPVTPEAPGYMSVRGVQIERIAKLSSLQEVTVEELGRLIRERSKGSSQSGSARFLQSWSQMEPSNCSDMYRADISEPATHPLQLSIERVLAHQMWSSNVGMSEMMMRRSNDGTYRKWRDEVMGVINGRAIFVTEDGGMGLAPAEARIGDIVCILFGLPVPCVLREADNSGYFFLFVGTCYLDGMMTRTALEKLKERHAGRHDKNAKFERDFILQ